MVFQNKVHGVYKVPPGLPWRVQIPIFPVPGEQRFVLCALLRFTTVDNTLDPSQQAHAVDVLSIVWLYDILEKVDV